MTTATGQESSRPERIRVIRNTAPWQCVAEVNGLEAAYAVVRLFCGRSEPRSDFWFRVVTP